MKNPPGFTSTGETDAERKMKNQFYNELKELRNNQRDRLVKAILSKKGHWTRLYEMKAGIRFLDLHLTQDLSFGEKNVESYFFLK